MTPEIWAAIISGIFAVIAAFVGKMRLSRRRSSSASPQPDSAKETRVNRWAEVNADAEYGAFYRSKSQSGSQILTVLVHGVNSDFKSAWDEVPNLLRDAVDQSIGFDLISFAYPARLFEQSSIKTGSDLLKNALAAVAAKYDHIIFVAHSTGGLVVKQFLLTDMEDTLSSMDAEEWKFNDSVVLRTRQVINFAVPHSGGALLPSLLLWPGYLLLLILILLCVVFSKSLVVKRKGFRYGLNRIWWELRHNNPRLLKLEGDYRTLVAQFDQRRLPRPASCEVNGRKDILVKLEERKTADDDIHGTGAKNQRKTSSLTSTRLIMSGTHPEVKEAKTKDDPVVRYLASFFQRYGQENDVLLAVQTIMSSVAINRDSKLIGSDEIERPDYSDWDAAVK